jgi:chemotaxis methyl-accepting protein methylase
VRLGQLDRYFAPVGDAFQVREELRRQVHFSQDDLTSPRTAAPAESVFGSFDLVLCRNLLIYFDGPLRRRVVDKLLQALAPGGYLVLGETEWLDGAAALQLTEVDRRYRIYCKDKGARG